ncbi:TerB family tellurite resistance protein [Azohydromonas caseinilytica]|uniref:TerB family tellurite resistance protein n=1 Tax=Azohydromonas caseinilytica TaxID=2728836 RepID=A0A848F651_9BURK|nr:TerB family tellurite resistance protein [Azohydromonas caseinilytica]NML13581.1 TerB family tellurite resistance protein [Azohydromonas caseinilytica]
MRSYPHNSPQAAARIVALTMLADGHFSHDEFQALERMQAAQGLGLLPSELMEVLHDCCEDLQSHPQLAWDEACRVDQATLSTLLDEVSDPALRRQVLQCCRTLAQADRHIAEGEAVMLATVAAWWQLPDPLPSLREAPRAAA